ncbi:hypothetical protein Ccrd_019364 [Cynara cardunculus var. scolymus]|uniref:Uncharacterized protein n=1 Tax=Cynara cardunculus var. scolymus TaxID=59895 RepID=A0A118K166_CYNCS|nr:hypothetical protein Ccrd_019364 [Cynara cardunculus var. scolymus]
MSIQLRADQMEEKYEQPKFEPSKPSMEETGKQMLGSHSAQSPRYGLGCIKTSPQNVQSSRPYVGSIKTPHQGVQSPRLGVGCTKTPHQGAKSPRHGVGCIKIAHPGVQDSDGMRRVPSEGKINCLCSPTTHVGSFRCRFHRSNSNLSNNSRSAGRSFNSLSNLADAHD